MEVFKTNKQIFTWIRILSPTEETNRYTKIATILICIGCLVFQFVSALASVCFFVKHIQVDLESSLYALFQIAAMSSAFYITIVAFFLRHEMSKTFTKFQLFCESSKFKRLSNQTVSI